MKKHIVSLLAVCLLVTAMPVQVFAATDTPFTAVGGTTTSGTWGDNGGTWKFNSSTGELTVSGHGEMPEYGLEDAPWFSLHSQIKSVVFSDDITYIGNNSFGFEFPAAQYENLTNVALPKALQEIGINAFRGAPLKSIVLPTGLKTIDQAAFADTINHNPHTGKCFKT